MEYELPLKDGFTVYSKSGCINCKKIKDIIIKNNMLLNVIDCDEYLIENKNLFLLFINKLSNVEHKYFPIIFHDSNYIGGFDEAKKYIDKLCVSFDD
jgi:glutaredoxin